MKYLSIIVIAALALVSCGGKLDACGCVSEATNMIKDMESAEDLETFEAKLEEAHPECADIDDKEVEENCKEEMEAMTAAMMSMVMGDLGDAMEDLDLDQE